MNKFQIATAVLGLTIPAVYYFGMYIAGKTINSRITFRQAIKAGNGVMRMMIEPFIKQ